MTALDSVKARTFGRQIAGVIASPADWERACRLRKPPDLFELRLDALLPCLPMVEGNLGKLRRPYIVTARHPAEGGLFDLSSKQRRELLLRFLPEAFYVDVELRSARTFAPVLETARALGIKRIISVHNLKTTPGAAELQKLAARAATFSPDIFKIATRVDTADELARLLQFFDAMQEEMQISAMGIGRLGLRSRLALARRGSALNYAHLNSGHVEGQASLAQIRRALLRSKQRAE